MIIYIREFKALIDAWEYCHKIKNNKALISKPIIIERKRRGNIKSITVVAKLKKKR